MAIPLPVYFIFLWLNYDPWYETAAAESEFSFGGRGVPVTNVRTAKHGGGDWEIIRFDYDGPIDADGACMRREYRYPATDGFPGMHEIPNMEQTSEWWPGETIKFQLLADAWPLYECRFDNVTYSATVTPTNRVFMWRSE